MKEREDFDEATGDQIQVQEPVGKICLRCFAGIKRVMPYKEDPNEVVDMAAEDESMRHFCDGLADFAADPSLVAAEVVPGEFGVDRNDEAVVSLVANYDAFTEASFKDANSGKHPDSAGLPMMEAPHPKTNELCAFYLQEGNGASGCRPITSLQLANTAQERPVRAYYLFEDGT